MLTSPTNTCRLKSEIIINKHIQYVNIRNIKKQIYLAILLSIFSIKISIAQTEIKNIIALSPNAGALSKYGEIPVSNFTGIPSIDLPIYTLKSGDIEMPISLSYHAGGNKVETIASWVGMGWSLSGIPIISRSVNGLPDDGPGGYFYMYDGLSVQQVLDKKETDPITFKTLLQRAAEGIVDTQPDIFYYSINGENGKFYYDQKTRRFITFPKSNILIEKDTGFKITSDDGTVYLFHDDEVTSTSVSGPTSDIISSWQISKIINVNQTDTITFNYEQESNITRGLTSMYKFQLLGPNDCAFAPNDSGNQSAISTIKSKTLASINFKNGYIQFSKNALDREDLVGGHSLKNIRIYNKNNTLLRVLEFNYSFLAGSAGSGSGCLINDSFLSNKWMFLENVKELDGNNQTQLNHSFLYDQAPPPCRTSFAQDYWGYYNGAKTNVNLIPTATPPGTNLQIEGADRTVNPSFTQFGILKRYSYPTGGFTEFEYENNDSNSSYLPKKYIGETAQILIKLEESLPQHAKYTSTFIINNPPDTILNLGKLNGGAIINVTIGPTGVPTGSFGAKIRITGISAGNRTEIFILESFRNYYVPNGTYEMIAEFDQDEPNYQNFFFMVDWKKIDSARVNSFVGGLRIKEIRTFEKENTSPMIKRYSYTDSYNSDISSGDIFGLMSFNYVDLFKFGTIQYSLGFPHICETLFYRSTSFSNQGQITHSGSYVGYRKVFIKTDKPDFTGVTSFDYSHAYDIVRNTYPYPPSQSQESFRGQLKEFKEFKLIDKELFPVKSEKFEYINKQYLNSALSGIKLGTTYFQLSPDQSVPTPDIAIYQIFPNWSELSRRIETIYNPLDTNLTVINIVDYKYDDTYNMATSIEKTSSEGKKLTIKNYYPFNIIFNDQNEIPRLWLYNMNNLTALLKQEQYTNQTMISSKAINYRNFNGANLVKPHHIILNYGNTSAAFNTYFDLYDNEGRLLQDHVENGIRTSYLWNKNDIYPFAKIKNADYQTVQNILGASALDNFCNSYNPDKNSINNFISPLYTALPNIEITTYSYEPLVGIKSITDPKGATIYFEYDSFQRLKYMLDNDGNIIKHYLYNYQKK